MTQDATDDGRGQVDRRSALKLFGGAALGAAGLATVGTGSAVAQTPSSNASRTTSSMPSCTLTPEITEGPYYLDLEKVRSDIHEDRPGVPLRVRFLVMNTETCEPLRHAAVDIWHCDARGTYSGYDVPEPTSIPAPDPTKPPPTGTPPANQHVDPVNDKTFLRGVQLTDHQGYAEFETIYPGWYNFRAVHIHVKVHVAGTITGRTYQGGHVSHTGQFFMPDGENTTIAALKPYVDNPITRLTNEQDLMYDETGSSGVFTVSKDRSHARRRGLLATVSMSVNPSATPAPA